MSLILQNLSSMASGQLASGAFLTFFRSGKVVVPGTFHSVVYPFVQARWKNGDLEAAIYQNIDKTAWPVL
jgi:hypothetical protein